MLWSKARYDLGLSEAEFWKLSPRQLDYLSRRHDQHRDRMELLAGIIASTAANYSMRAPQEPCCPADFMPSRRGKDNQPELTDQELAAQINAVLLPRSIPVRHDASDNSC